MRKYIEYYCKECDETYLEKDIIINALLETFCPNCGSEIEEVDSYIDL